MIIILTSFFAGILSVLAPCVLPMIPILLWGWIIWDKRKPLRIIWSAMICIFVFTYLLKISTAFIDIDPSTWTWISWSIIGLYGLVLIFPELWDRAVVTLRNIRLLRRSAPRNDEISPTPRNDAVGDILLWASLWPIFATCSPTYALLLGTVLPVSTSLAVSGILAYMIGFGGFLYILTLWWRQIIKKFYNISDNNSRFKKTLWIVLVVLWICIATGYIKTIEANLISCVSDSSAVEQSLLEKWWVNTWIDEKSWWDGMNLIEEDLEVLDAGE
jgi:cytochrome c biogenesis protein CcdA